MCNSTCAITAAVAEGEGVGEKMQGAHALILHPFQKNCMQGQDTLKFNRAVNHSNKAVTVFMEHVAKL